MTRPSRPDGVSVRWCCTSTSNTPRSKASGEVPADSPGSRRPRDRSPPSRSGSWCANPDAQITVQPVIDLAEHIHVGSYQASARLKLQTQLRDHTCAFAFCSRPAEKCDCEHRVPHEDDGPTCSCNQAPCCRRHHRAKTTGGWTYVTVEPGVYLWRSPLGYQFLRDRPAPSTSPPTTNAANSPAPSPPTSANPDHPAPHPAQHHPSGAIGALSAAPIVNPNAQGPKPASSAVSIASSSAQLVKVV